MGLTGTGTGIYFETVAHKMGYVKKDIYEKLPEDNSAKGRLDIHRTLLNVELVAETLVNSVYNEIPIHVSSNAGRFLCEYIFYTSLNIDHTRTIFIHVPNTDKGFSVKQMALVIREVILLLIKQIHINTEVKMP